MSRRTWMTLAGGVVVAIVLSVMVHRTPQDTAEPLTGWVGSSRCATCHAEQAATWERSHHHLAMLPVPGDVALLAANDRPPLVARGAQLTFTETDIERLDGLAPVYALGRKHIEQYVAPFGGQRLQALPLAYDIVKKEWYDLFTGDARTPDDWGHWTNRGMNANAQCLVCHTTNFDRGYRLATDDYESRWSEIGVGCEACHGPGGAHVTARTQGGDDPWAGMDPDVILTTCGGCHSRRVERAPFTPGMAFLDAFEPEVLDTDVFHPDGQIKEELYELVSFQQSKMWDEGVRCWNCHDPHGNGTTQTGNAVCRSCHAASYDEPTHTHHPTGSPGASCIACHMPITVYMQRDPRHDHAFQRPDPELSRQLGVPNACDRCHGDRGNDWAAAQVAAWFPDDTVRRRHRDAAMAVAGGRANDPAAVPGLLTMLGARNAVRRASATRLLARFPTASGVTTGLLKALGDDDPLVRGAAAWAFGQRPALTPDVERALEAVVRDPVRTVRQHAAFALARSTSGSRAPDLAQAVEAAWREWQMGQRIAGDTPEAHYNLAIFHTMRGDLDGAAAAYQTALRLWPRSIQAGHNLGMLQAQRGDLAAAEAAFRKVVEVDDVPQSWFALGLLYGQQGRWADTIAALERCVGADPNYPRARYNLALAFAKAGDTKRALDELETAAGLADTRREAILTLVDLARQVNDKARLEQWVLEAAKLDPEVAENPALRDQLGE